MKLPFLSLLMVVSVGGADAAPRHHRAYHSTSPKPVTWVDYRDHPKGYLGAAERPDILAILPPPPAPDSPRGVADLATYRAMKALKDTPRWTQAKADADVEDPAATRAFACAAGMEITPQATPVTSLMLARVMTDVGASEDAAKNHYARKRPFLADDGDTCVDKADWLVKQGSYPSGHAGTGWAWALVLSEVEPDRGAALAKRGLSFGESRIICRVHFASDVEAGRLVGAAVVARLHDSPAFMSDLKRARAELRAARTTAPARCSAAESAGETR